MTGRDTRLRENTLVHTEVVDETQEASLGQVNLCKTGSQLLILAFHEVILGNIHRTHNALKN